MANPTTAFGFKPVGTLNGSPYSVRRYAKTASVATAIFPGDIVHKEAAGNVDPEGVAQNIPSVTVVGGTPGTTLIVGAALNYGAASTLTTHAVADDYNTIFIGRCSSTTVISVASHVGKNANHVVAAGDATTKQSRYAVDSTTIAVTADLDMRLLGISNVIGNEAGANAIVEVVFLKSILAQGAAGI